MKSIVFHENSAYIASLLLIALLSVIYRFSLLDNIAAQDIASVTENDTARYEMPALHFLENGTFAINPKDPLTSTIHNSPGYALFIAANYYIFGNDRYKLLKSQAIVSALSILLLAFATYLLWSWKASLLVALLMSLDPLQTLYSNIMLTETLQIFFTSLIIVFSVLMFTSRSQGKIYLWALLLGLAVTSAAFVHASHYYLIVPITLGIILFKGYLKWDVKKLINIILLILLPALIFFSAWQIRNGQLTGVYQFSDNSASTLLYYKASSVYAAKENLSHEEAIKKVEQEIGTDFSSLKERYEQERKLAKEIIFNNLDAFIIRALKQYTSVLFGVGFDGLGEHYDVKYHGNLASGVSVDTNPIIRFIENKTGKQFWYVSLTIYSLLFLFSSYALALIGYIHALKYSSKEYRVLHFFLLGLALYYIALSTGNIGAYHRQRLVSMTVVFLYASNGALLVLRHFYSSFRERRVDPMLSNTG